jgi:hypothetical protein
MIMSNESRAGNVFWEGLVHLIDDFDLNGSRYFEVFARQHFQEAFSIGRGVANYLVTPLLGGGNTAAVYSYADLVERMEELYLGSRSILCVIEGLSANWDHSEIVAVFDLIDMLQRISRIIDPPGIGLKLVVSLTDNGRS